jgi:hypothetical protein
MVCPSCATEQLSPEARFCTKCGGPLPSAGPRKFLGVVRFLALPLILVSRPLAYPIRLRQERIRWLTETNGPNSPVDDVQGLSDEAKRVYAYLATVTLRSTALLTPRPHSLRKSPSSHNTKHATQSASLNGAGFYHTDAGTHGMVAGRMGTTSSGSPTDSPVTASGFR